MKNKYFLLVILFSFYAVLSWILFFRDERALMVIGSNFYPQLNDALRQIRQVLLTLKLNTVPTLLFAGFLTTSFFLYFKILKQSVSVKLVIICAICLQLIVFFSYPILSTDVLSYILSDRVAVVYHQNVWTTKPDEFKADPYYELADWTDKTRIYGGVNQFFYSPITALSGNDFLANLLSHKIVVLIFVIAVIFLIPAAVIFLNPLFIIETVGSGHNDILMIFFVVLSLLTPNVLFSGILLGLATQVKIIPVLLFGFLSLKMLSDLKIKKLAVFVSSYTVTVGVIYFFMGVNPLETITRTTGSINVYWQSLPMLVNQFVPYLKPLLTLGLFTLLTLQSLRALIFRVNPVEIFGQTLLCYLLFFLSAFWNWYPIWLLILLPFMPEKSRLKPYILALTVSSMFGYVAYWTALRLNYQLWFWPTIMYLTVLSGPAGFFIYEKINRH